MKDYRKIYEDYYGSIPVDSNGRTYEIHHIDGNHSNNDITNLKAVTIEEHFKIHFEQEDYHACFMISVRMNLTTQELSHIASYLNKKRIANKTHHFLGESNPAKIKVKNGTHHLLKRPNGTSNASDRVAAKTHNFLGSDTQKNRLKNGTHPSQYSWTCPNCNKEGKGKGMFTRYHGDNCKFF